MLTDSPRAVPWVGQVKSGQLMTHEQTYGRGASSPAQKLNILLFPECWLSSTPDSWPIPLLLPPSSPWPSSVSSDNFLLLVSSACFSSLFLIISWAKVTESLVL